MSDPGAACRRQQDAISQLVEAPSAPSGGGYDAGKRIKGRKRHIAVDTAGSLLMVSVATAGISDSAGAQEIVSVIRQRWPWFKHGFGDGAHDRTKLPDAAAYRDFTGEISVGRKRPAIDAMASTFAGAAAVARAGGEAEIDTLHSKLGRSVVERDPGSSPRPPYRS